MYNEFFEKEGTLTVASNLAAYLESIDLDSDEAELLQMEVQRLLKAVQR